MLHISVKSLGIRMTNVYSDEQIRKFSETHKGLLVGDSNPSKTPESRRKISEALKGRVITPEWSKNMSIAFKKKWSDPEYRNTQIFKQKNGLKLKPNKKETQLEALLNSLYPNEFRFVGDGQIVIDGCCPDFINVNGKKQLVELFGTYWHGFKRVGLTREEAERQRIDRFAKYGYSTLIVWESELKNIDILKEKITNFVGQA